MTNKQLPIKKLYGRERERLAMSPPCIPEMRPLLYHLLVARDYQLWVGNVQVDGLLSFEELDDLFANYSKVEFEKDDKGNVIGACMKYAQTRHFLLFEKKDNIPRFAIC
jgi:hypothetical protein